MRSSEKKKRKNKRRDKRLSLESGGDAARVQDAEVDALEQALLGLGLGESSAPEVGCGSVDGLQVMPKAAATRREHVQRNRVLLGNEEFAKLAVGQGGMVFVSGGKSDARSLATVWVLDSLRTGQVQLSSSLLDIFEAGERVDISRIDEGCVTPCRHVHVRLTGVDRWSQTAALKVCRDAKVVRYMRMLLANEYAVKGTIFGIMLNGYFCNLVVEDTRCQGVGLLAKDVEIYIVNAGVAQQGGPSGDSVKFKLVGGLRGQIKEVMDVVELGLCEPKEGLRVPRGVLLFGPPGTGKTLIARSVGTEFGANIYVLNGAEIINKYVGHGERKINEMFSCARENQPAMIFIDEIDALCPARSTGGGDDQIHNRIVALLLRQIDELHNDSMKVVVLGATNRVNAIDLALRRPGRFDREIEIGIPNEQDRVEILKVHLAETPHTLATADISSFASTLHGFVGADIMALCREACWKALRRHKGSDMSLCYEDLVESRSVITPSALRELTVEVPHTRWDDVGGQETVKQQLKEAVEWPLQHPEAFERMGIRPPQGVLLFGPPGCSKTLLAKAIATEGHMNFIAIKGPELFNKWVGESEKAVHELFRKARMAEPSVIFFDEIDALAGSRGSSSNQGAGGVADRVLSQMLTEMDGIGERKRVVVVAATNRPDIVDPALLRPGRLDRKIYVPPPDSRARLEILKIHTKSTPLGPDVNLESLSETTTKGFSGAEIASLCREAAMYALQQNMDATQVTHEHFEFAACKIQPQITQEMLKFYQELLK
uniref:AAA+ ATPase domain-containing protein n=1 Tax=Mucochytrium quahogii TaxID=96639 RepID=A0A7S2WD52_9STRA|mmetsp:Transcript_16457/g.28530  ORF Transcript_16457/g.28530 Transcript_16457/m.28530 type:complete len:773 (+) Transcript_16457:206-2524(+)|eukprot:CAMPEP_0203747320 /NCGR_PEP_ID=MMETSP0098-20131031/2501_1 /ASSEMBLY_ACC=CAM_ASM_000208 /TAXON_ID=96639 /ORGANISM=" , Strain NY0313808BC1" /LENGTH=772 /DNA_ID=CAMNT_0050635707 /DNA_START=3144 /DNA_END=5462 /DNA_ORIENTATION=-